MAVTDDANKVVGMLTVNDIMRAYFEGIPSDKQLADWLASGNARAPARLLERIVVHPSASLVEVAEKMVGNAVAGDCACHHIVVNADDGELYGVISSHDLVKELCHHRQHTSLFTDMFAPPDAAEKVGTSTVRDAMKHRERVFTGLPKDTMKDALRVLLVTQQNSILVVDDVGIYGFITPRDAVKAYADGIPNSVGLAEWLSGRHTNVEDRMIASDALLADAAALMSSKDVDHLVVVHPQGREVVGVLSSLDVVLRTRAHAPILRSMPLWLGPTVGEVLQEHKHLTELCAQGTTLSQAAEVLASSGRTSLMVSMSAGPAHLGLLTENDIVRAYVDGWARDAAVEDLLTPLHAAVPQHLQVPPSMPLTEAASLMLTATEPGHTCHHLVVRAVTGGWLGIFSALDVARAIHGLSSELDVAKAGADQVLVDMIMKPLAIVPKCKPTDRIRDALCTLDIFGENATLVEDSNGVHGLITPRCALQALTNGVPRDRCIAAWLQSRQSQDGPREVLLGSPMVDAAAVMAKHSLHHLLVVEARGARPRGVLSSLDVVRGVASTNYRCPFLTLGWLRQLAPGSFSLQAPQETLTVSHKRPGSAVAGDEGVAPAGVRPRVE